MSCDVCWGTDWTDDDQIIICERCFAASHQKCFRQEIDELVPSGDWFCQRCTKLGADENLKATSIECTICTQKKGILVHIETSVVPLLSGKWVHIHCINWIPQLKFRSTKVKKDIVYFDNLTFNSLSEIRGKCESCQKKDGLVMSCDYLSCLKKYHPRCMVQAKLI